MKLKTLSILLFLSLFLVKGSAIDVVETDTTWLEITESDGFVLDIRYATINNFTKEVIYNCPRCYVRKALAEKLYVLRDKLDDQGYKIKLFDCYRPKPAQEKLWDIVPNKNYVTPPEKGSMHNRGLAVDLTLLDANGNQLDMGTAYDHFGKEAHIEYLDITPEVKRNRAILFSSMKKVGLSGIRTEWWHYSLKNVGADFSNWEWDCD